MNIPQRFPSHLPCILSGPLLVALVLALSACGTPNAPATKAAATASGTLSDGEILQVLRTLNDGEIEQAELAREKSDNQRVNETAQTIIRDHRSVNERVDSIAQSGTQLEESPLSNGLEMQLGDVRDDLEGLSGAEFDCTYLQKQVDQHRLALDTIRSELQPAAEGRQLQELLSTAEPGLERHMQAARDARNSIPECSGN